MGHPIDIWMKCMVSDCHPHLYYWIVLFYCQKCALYFFLYFKAPIGLKNTILNLVWSCFIWILKLYNCIHVLFYPLGTFAKLRKATVNFILSVCLSIGRMEPLGSHGADFSWNYIFWYFFFGNLKRKLRFHKNQWRKRVHYLWTNIYIYVCVCVCMWSHLTQFL